MSKQNQDGFPDRNSRQNLIDRIKDYIQQNGFCWSSQEIRENGGPGSSEWSSPVIKCGHDGHRTGRSFNKYSSSLVLILKTLLKSDFPEVSLQGR